MTKTNLNTKIDSLINQKKSFALWRIPGETCIHYAIQTEKSPSLLYDIESLNGRSGYVIAPFNISEVHPIVLISPENTGSIEIDAITENNDLHDLSSGYSFVSEEKDISDYKKKFKNFLQALASNKQEKLVLSRKKTVLRQGNISISKAFIRAVKRYIYSYVYICYTPQTGIWMGSTPEILLAGSKNKWQTVALAGTQRLKDGKLPETWDEKNIREQALVATYIRQKLLSLNILTESKGPFPVKAGELSHLKTEFIFNLDNENIIGKVIKALHPTPAVCGLPKEIAYNFILKEEGYDRSYYSGFIGMLKPGGQSDLYVNLRCMNISPDKFTFYAGGGLLSSSSLEDEWNETEDKMMTMERLFL